ncbi:mucin-13-like [Maylandia zebra]|uniref:mucin-13-like n=2 Tax=Maylandia zebra TaxID=106582 RepID=UPI00403C8D02
MNRSSVRKLDPEAELTHQDHTAAVTDAPATSPDHTAAVTDAPATSSDPTPAVTDAPATSSDPSSSATGVPPTSASPDPCLSNPCGVGSTCEARANHTFVCKCLPGDFYNNITLRCENAKVFPGKLSLRKPFNEKMKDTTSKEFKETADEIVAALDEVYKGQDGYSGSVVLKLLPSASRMLRAPPGIIAVLQIIFKASSEIKEDDVIKELENNTCDNCVLSGATFEPTDLCAENPCDVKTSNCTSQDGAYSCTCLEKHLQTDFSDRMCTACPSGSRFKDNTCVKCSFGYSGLECSENWQLILVIVGSVLGGLLLIALILLPIIPTISSKKISKTGKDGDIENPYMNQDSFTFKGFTTLPIFSNGAPKLPRATNSTTTISITNLEITSNSRQSPVFVDNSSELYSDQNNTNSQAQHQNNLYAVKRPQIKPHAQSQGYDNPYYQYDSESNFS